MDNYLLTNPNKGSQIKRMSWIMIKYDRCIKYKATPYNPEFDEYFERFKYKTAFECIY